MERTLAAAVIYGKRLLCKNNGAASLGGQVVHRLLDAWATRLRMAYVSAQGTSACELANAGCICLNVARCRFHDFEVAYDRLLCFLFLKKLFL
jgi:hypothetical protein